MKWKTCGASVLGSHHRDGELPCQDAHAIQIGASGQLALVVADGAGSARRSDLGATLLAQGVAEALIACREDTVDAITQAVEGAVTALRETLLAGVTGESDFPEDEEPVELRDYAATLVACRLGSSGGVFLHIGDGAAIALPPGDSDEPLVSPPENGEYANETFFFTMSSWREHLRVSSFGPEMDTVLLMSDGVTPLALGRDGSPFMPFIGPLHKHLVGWERDVGERRVAATLGSEQVDHITGDDRTLLWASKATSG